MNNVDGPLKGIKILDIGTMLAAPLAATVLADQGAEVIKIEPLGLGDVMRFVGATRNGVSALFQGANRGKRSLALDMKTPQGLAIVKSLVEGADILLHNFRPGVAEKLGVDYASMRAINPQLIYLSVTGFGHEGPYAKRAAYDNVVQAFTGIAFSQADQETGEPTQYYQIFADKISAMYASQALTAALLARERGAGGQHLQLAMTDAVISFMWPDVAGTATFLEEGADPGMEIAKGVRLMQFKNGYGQAAPVNDAQFHGWCKAFDVDSSAPELATVVDRMGNKAMMETVSAEIAARAAQMDVDEGVARMEALDVPCAKAMHLHDLPQHPQMQANGTFVESTHPDAGRILEPKTPVNFGETPSTVGMPCARLGLHTDEILAELDYDTAAIEQLRADNIVE